jgi:hypothetical protein
VHDAGDLGLVQARPVCRFTITEAVGFCSSRRKAVCLGIARCTRAPATLAMDEMVRDSSPSRARW